MSQSFTTGGEDETLETSVSRMTGSSFKVPGDEDGSMNESDHKKHHFSMGPSETWIRNNRPVHRKFEYLDSHFPSMLRFNGKSHLYHITAKKYTKRKLMRTYLSRLRNDTLKKPPRYRSPASYFHSEIPMTCAEISFLALKLK